MSKNVYWRLQKLYNHFEKTSTCSISECKTTPVICPSVLKLQEYLKVSKGIWTKLKSLCQFAMFIQHSNTSLPEFYKKKPKFDELLVSRVMSI